MSSKPFLAISFLLTVMFVRLKAQPVKGTAPDASKKVYRSTPEKVNDLVHTKLQVKFDFEKSYLYGQEWVQLKPHFYSTDSLRLDAKGMEIKQVGIVSNGKIAKLGYSYENGMELSIKLDRLYKGGE